MTIQRADLTEQVYEILRDRLVTRSLQPGAKLSLQSLADEFRVSRSPVHHALTRLCVEGLVSVRARQGYCVTPLDARVVINAYEIRLALEIATAEKTVGRVSPDELAEFRRLMEQTLPFVKDGRFGDIQRFNAANQTFHNYQVDLAKNDMMSNIYRNLAVNLMMDRILFGQKGQEDLSISSEHNTLVEAFEAANLQRVKAVIRSHCETGKRVAIQAIESGGGVL